MKFLQIIRYVNDLKNPIRRIQKTLIKCYLGFLVLIALPMEVVAQFSISTGAIASSFYYDKSRPSPYFDFDVDLRPYLGYDIELVQLSSQQPLIAPSFSAAYKFFISNKIGIRPELRLSQKGVSFRQLDYERIAYKVKIAYLELPISVVYQFTQKDNSGAELYFGGYGAMNVDARKIVRVDNGSIERSRLNSVKRYSGGMHLGASLKRQVLNNFCFIDFRVFVGLDHIFLLPETWTDLYFENRSTKITGAILSLGYEF